MNLKHKGLANMSASSSPSPGSTTEVLLGLYVAWILIMFISLAGNSLVIYIVFNRPNMKSPTNYQFVNMAGADLLITIFSMPIWAYFICVKTSWVDGIAGDVTCSIAAGASIVSVLASVLTLITISVDRFLAVFFPLRRATITRNTKLLTLIIWFFSLTFGVPSNFMYSVREEDGRLQCLNKLETSNMSLRKAYFLTLFSVMFVIPLFVMSVMYSMVAYKLWFRKVPGNQSSVSRRSIIAAKRKIVRMLIILVLAFAVCWTPVFIGWYIQVFESKSRKEALLIMLPHANSALNPCLYFLLNTSFRRQFTMTFKSCRKNSEHNFQPTPTHSQKSSSPRLIGTTIKRIERLRYSSKESFECSRRGAYTMKEIPKPFAPVTLLRMANEGGNNTGYICSGRHNKCYSPY